MSVSTLVTLAAYGIGYAYAGWAVAVVAGIAYAAWVVQRGRKASTQVPPGQRRWSDDDGRR